MQEVEQLDKEQFTRLVHKVNAAADPTFQLKDIPLFDSSKKTDLKGLFMEVKKRDGYKNGTERLAWGNLARDLGYSV